MCVCTLPMQVRLFHYIFVVGRQGTDCPQQTDPSNPISEGRSSAQFFIADVVPPCDCFGRLESSALYGRLSCCAFHPSRRSKRRGAKQRYHMYVMLPPDMRKRPRTCRGSPELSIWVNLSFSRDTLFGHNGILQGPRLASLVRPLTLLNANKEDALWPLQPNIALRHQQSYSGSSHEVILPTLCFRDPLPCSISFSAPHPCRSCMALRAVGTLYPDLFFCRG